MARVLVTAGVAALVIGVGVSFACGSSTDGEGDGSSGGASSGVFGGGGDRDGAKGPCVGLQCKVASCSGRAPTSIKGRVFAPEGTVPLYNAIVYVPNEPVEPFKSGVACDKCGAVSGSPVVSALTNEQGDFVLENVPSGDNIPLVIQIGKWRRQLTLPKVEDCTSTALDAGQTRLPRNKSEGDMPQIAFTSGNADSLECFLKKLGIDLTEFSTPLQDGRVHFYTGNGSSLAGGGSPPAATLWDDERKLLKYDIAVLSCEGSERTADKQAHYLNVQKYLNAGGRLFASHYHYVWFRYGPQPFPTTADWANSPSTSSPYSIDVDFPKGNAFADWLVNVGASTTRGSIDLVAVRNSVGDSMPSISRRWIHSKTPATAKYFSFNTPVGTAPENQCGRAVFTDVHVSAQEQGSTSTFPGFCNTDPLNANEKALIFLFFDLSSCVQDESKEPAPPGPK
jgi:hypothetical protein